MHFLWEECLLRKEMKEIKHDSSGWPWSWGHGGVKIDFYSAAKGSSLIADANNLWLHQNKQTNSQDASCRGSSHTLSQLFSNTMWPRWRRHLPFLPFQVNSVLRLQTSQQAEWFLAAATYLLSEISPRFTGRAACSFCALVFVNIFGVFALNMFPQNNGPDMTHVCFVTKGFPEGQLYIPFLLSQHVLWIRRRRRPSPGRRAAATTATRARWSVWIWWLACQRKNVDTLFCAWTVWSRCIQTDSAVFNHSAFIQHHSWFGIKQDVITVMTCSFKFTGFT